MDKLYSIKDIKAAVFSPPMPHAHDPEAIRSFERIINEGKSVVSNHPDEFELWGVGVWNDQTGKIEEAESKFIINGVSLVKKGM